MNLFIETWHLLADWSMWTTGGFGHHLLEHALVSVVLTFIAALFALPCGIWLGHTRFGPVVAGNIAGSARAIPALGLLVVLGLLFGYGLTAPLLTLFLLALPSLLVAGYTAVQSIPVLTREAARAIGYSPFQVAWHVEVPLGAGVLLGGVRNALLQVTATASIVAYTYDLGLGRYLFAGVKTRDYPLMLAGALLLIALTLVLDFFVSQLRRLFPSHATSDRVFPFQDSVSSFDGGQNMGQKQAPLVYG